MKKKIFTAMLALTIVTAFAACNSSSNETKETGKEKLHDVHDGDNHNKDDGHQHDTTHKNEADTLGMKMGGNELDSKKK
jgi:Ni/Co efflux regulator RcnB